MEFSIVIAQVFALYLVISGVFLILKGKTLPIILKDFFAHPAIVYLAGVFLIFLGATLILQQGASDSTSGVIISTFGWLALLKGLTYIFLPKVLADVPVKKFRPWLGLAGVVIIVIGVLLFRAI